MKLQLTDGAGRPIRLDQRLGRGGEGEVYSVQDAPDAVAKLLYPKGRTNVKFEKLEAMVARPPSGAYDDVEGLPVLTWPRALLYEEAGRTSRRRPIGYTMARVHERDFVPFYKVTSASRRKGLGGVPLSWDRLVLLGIRMCHVVRTLHRLDYAVGDMNDRNVLISRRFTPLFMDTDSFQVPRLRGGHYPCVVGDQTYWPPEHLDVDYASYKGSRVTGDLYALSVLLFQLFMSGHRPYQARGVLVDGFESLVEKTRAGHYPWVRPQRGVLEPPGGAPDYRNLPSSVQTLFERSFVRGHHKPKRRPTADDWYKALYRVRENGYATCTRHPAHVYARDERECPWCKDTYNPFGLAGGRTPPPPAPLRRPRTRRTPLQPAPIPVAIPVRKPTPVKATLESRAAPASSRKARKIKATPTTRPAPRKSRRTTTPSRRRTPPRRGLLVRAAWTLGVVLACTTSLWVLPSFPMGPAKQVTLFALSTLWAAVGLLAVTWRVLPRERVPLATVGYVAAGGTVSAGFALAGGWVWLDYANATAALGLGLLVFILLERRQPRAFWPRPRGVVHALAAVAASCLPIVVVWMTDAL